MKTNNSKKGFNSPSLEGKKSVSTSSQCRPVTCISNNLRLLNCCLQPVQIYVAIGSMLGAISEHWWGSFDRKRWLHFMQTSIRTGLINSKEFGGLEIIYKQEV